MRRWVDWVRRDQGWYSHPNLGSVRHEGRGKCEWFAYPAGGEKRGPFLTMAAAISAVTPAAVRFWEKVDKGSGDGCWEWTGPKNWAGYGRFSFGRKESGAHRVAYELRVGPIPAGLEIDHLCRNRGCVNPSHLEAVSPKVNQHRSESPWGLNARKTHCKRGHLLAGDNLRPYELRRGGRSCRQCTNDLKRAARRARRGLPA